MSPEPGTILHHLMPPVPDRIAIAVEKEVAVPVADSGGAILRVELPIGQHHRLPGIEVDTRAVTEVPDVPAVRGLACADADEHAERCIAARAIAGHERYA